MAAMPSVGRIQQLSVVGVVAAACLGVSASSASAGRRLAVGLPRSRRPGRSAGSPFDGPSRRTDAAATRPAAAAARRRHATVADQRRRRRHARVGSTRRPATTLQASCSSSRRRGLGGRPARRAPSRCGPRARPATATARSTASDLRRPRRATPDVRPLRPEPRVRARAAAVARALRVDAGRRWPSASPTSSDSRRSRVGGVSRSSPVDAARCTLTSGATDAGVGLDRAEAAARGHERAAVPAPSPPTVDCRDLTPGDATIDLPASTPDCTPRGRPSRSSVARVTSDGRAGARVRDHRLHVAVTRRRRRVRRAGNAALDQRSRSRSEHPDLGTPIAHAEHRHRRRHDAGQPRTAPAAGGGVAGAQAQPCRSPRLSVSLDSRSRCASPSGVPVLQAEQALPLQRPPDLRDQRQAPLGAEAHARSTSSTRSARRRSTKPGTHDPRQGRGSPLILAYTSSRTLIFRFTNSDGQRSQVRSSVKVDEEAAKR